MVPSSARSMREAEGSLGSPGMVIMSPPTTTTKPAPADKRTSRTWSSCPVGAPSEVGSVEKEYCVFATHTGSAPYPSRPARSSRRRALASHVTRPGPYSRVAMASTFAVRERSSS
jgi:hypothetical protein